MIISEKQIFELIMFSTSYLELISIIISKGITMNFPKEIQGSISSLLNEITRQQSKELKVIE
jgi:hypothetical protein